MATSHGDSLYHVTYRMPAEPGCEEEQTPIPCRGEQQIREALAAIQQRGGYGVHLRRVIQPQPSSHCGNLYPAVGQP